MKVGTCGLEESKFREHIVTIIKRLSAKGIEFTLWSEVEGLVLVHVKSVLPGTNSAQQWKVREALLR